MHKCCVEISSHTSHKLFDNGPRGPKHVRRLTADKYGFSLENVHILGLKFFDLKLNMWQYVTL
jgi:hypothetical protein